ncbi:MAG: hypothetical protein E7384_04905 [Ruminococcaceae bacterium]|nr:hypothetical protein [Oscillospiraceae bacterium]
MWEEIALALGTSILEAIGTKLLDHKSKIKVKKQLNKIVDEQFECFSDTSLDSDAFNNLVKSDRFVEIIRNYFFMVRDNISIEEYRSNIENLILNECTSTRIVDVKAFINKIEALYIDFLRKIVEDYPGICASFQLMSISHREIVSKIRDSQNELMRYLATLDNRKTIIDNESIKQYHIVAEKEFGEIRFTGIAGAERRKSQNINEFYVENTFSYFGKDIDKLYEYNFEEIEAIKLENFFDLGNKIILIGGAGLGKSTTLNYLFCNYENLCDATALKLKIDLKEYAEEIGEKKKGILWCIANEFVKRIKYSGQTIEEIQVIVAEKLNSGSCLIMLDALDEIPTLALRNTVRREIETFTSVYYLNRFIISTREAGYLKNRFDETFLHIRINQFDSEQIKQYSKNWYLSYYEDSTDFDEFWSKFDGEVKRARCHSLIRNPIILVLALVIFDFESSLPTRRIEFYQKCIDTFLTERENRKAAIKLSDKTKSILAMNLTVPQIAFYRHNKLSQNSSFRFNYYELKKAIKESISVEDEINWVTAVDEYSEYLVERTELIQEIDEDLLDFAHKTFYEYFLAFYFSKMCDNQELVNLLRGWIGDSNYDELARLIIEVVIKNDEPRQHDCIINCLFELLCKDDVFGEESPNIHDVFDVVSDLYTHNLLQPKYQYNYNKFVLYNPRIIDFINFKLRRMEVKNNLALYDSKLVGELFLEDYRNDKLIDVIDAIYYLNNEFKKIVIPSDSSSLLYHINELFTALHDSKKKSKIDTGIIEYFMNEGIEYTLKYPQIFMAVVVLMVKTKFDLPIEKLLKYEFTPRNVFYNYASPEILYSLIEKAMESKTYLALLLSISIDCALRASNMVYYFMFSCSKRPRRKAEHEDVLFQFCINLWRALNKTDSVKEFKVCISDMEMYDEQYDQLYERIYRHYTDTEKGLEEEHLKRFLKQ